MTAPRPGPVLVTGCSGLLGRFVVAALRAAGWRTVGVDITAANDGGPDTMIVGDAGDPDLMARAAEGCVALVHLAGLPDPFRGSAFEVFETNTRLANAAVAAADAARLQRLVLASSQTVLGLGYSATVRAPRYVPVDEAHPQEPTDAYSLSKGVSEQLFAMAARRFGIIAIGLRFPVIWDPTAFEAHTRRRLDNPEQAAKSMWAYIDGRDAGRAVALALEAPVEGWRAYNVAAPEVFADEDAGSLVRRWYPGPPAGSDALEGRRAVFSSERARRELGFEAEHLWTAGEIRPRTPA